MWLESIQTEGKIEEKNYEGPCFPETLVSSTKTKQKNLDLSRSTSCYVYEDKFYDIEFWFLILFQTNRSSQVVSLTKQAWKV